MFKKVLVPLDGSETAERSLSYVTDMTKTGCIGEVILLNVAVIDLPHNYIGKDFDFPTFWETQLEKSKKYLSGVQARLKAEGVEAKTVAIETGWPAQVIDDYAQQKGIDLIVITSSGNTGMKKLMFGSVALSVLHDSRVPVLMIRP